MTNIKTKLAGAVATATLLVAGLTPAAFAATNTAIVGTGAFSVNGVVSTHTSTSVVSQGNYQSVFTGVNVKQSTGKNTSSFNVGSGNSVTSGGTTATVGTTVGGNSNSAVVTSPCGCGGTSNALIAGTGAFSYNSIVVNDSTSSVVSQSNVSHVTTVVGVNQSTGHNSSAFNVGGSSSVTSGGTTATVGTTVTGGTNSVVE